MSFINLNKIVLFMIAFVTLVTISGIVLMNGISNPSSENSSSTMNAEASSTSIPEPDSYLIIVKKSQRKLFLYNGKQRLLKTYKIALGTNPIGTKTKQGDGATPEGDYYLTHKNPKSKFYLSLGVSFPNSKDAATGLKNKLISQTEHNVIVAAINGQQKPLQNTNLGGDIFLHGGGTNSDWTLGCIALSNEDIKELFDLLPLKTRIKIEP